MEPETILTKQLSAAINSPYNIPCIFQYIYR
jgi:hypothetical protein